MEASGSIIISGVIDGISITSANVLYALQSTANYNNGQTPGDTAFTYDNFPPLNAGYYVWQATKITDSDGKISITGKMCLGPTTDFLDGTEVYATDASNTTPPANSSFGTTYTKEKGYYLWTATRVQYTNGNYAYLNKKCVGYWGEDGNGIQSVARTYARSKNSTSTNDTTAPSNIDTSIGTNGWAASSPSVTETYPYLWVKEVVTYTKSEATTKYYCIGARGANGVDAQDIEWVYIRTKTNVAPVISGDGGNSPYTDHNSKTYTSDDHLPKVVAGSGGSLDDIEDGNSGSSSKKYECTDDPKGVDSTWKFEWEIKREKGAADANGHRAWQAYSGTMTLHNRYVKDITSANVWYALADSGTTKPGDSSFTLDAFPTTLNAGKYVWEATKVTYSDGTSEFTAKMCLGPTTDFLSGTEVYAISTSNSTAPAENTTNWKTTYEKTKGYYLWTATRVQYTNGNYAYLNKKCVGYWGEDGNGIQSVTRTYARSKQSTSTNDTTAPSDIDTSIGTSGWAATSPSVNETYPYLWVKEVVTYTKSTATTKYYCIGARGANGVDAQDIEWVYIRTKTPVAPVISGDGGSSPYTDHNSKTYTSDDHLPKVVAGSGGSLNDIEDGNSGNTSKKYECTDDPKGVDSTWKYEWEIKREKGAADANGHRAWQAYSGTMTLHNRMPVSIASANVWYALSDSGTTAPADSVFDDAQTGFDDFPPLNSGKYIWQATKITDSNGATSYTGKMCLGPTTDFLEGTEVYATDASNTTPPANSSFGTTYTKEKGKYLWTATRVKYANQTNYTYLNKKCVGYWGEDGKSGTKFQRMYKSTGSGTYTGNLPAAYSDNSNGWYKTPTAVSSSARYRWVTERSSDDGGTTWTDWSTPQIETYLAADGTSINITGTAVGIISGSQSAGDVDPSPTNGDIVLDNTSYPSGNLYTYSGSSWTASSVVKGTGYICSADGHLYMASDSNAAGKKWIDCGQIKGDKGDPAEYYALTSPSIVTFNRNFANVASPITSTLVLTLTYSIGGTQEKLTSIPSGMTLKTSTNGTSWTTPSNQSLTRNVSTDFGSGNSVNERVYYGLFKGTALVDSDYTDVYYEIQRMLIPQGQWDDYNNYQFARTNTTTPLVYLGGNNGGTYWYLAADTNNIGTSSSPQWVTPGTNESIWVQATNYEVILAKMLFAEFARLGSYIVYDRFFFSQYGTLVYKGSNGNTLETVVNASNVARNYNSITPIVLEGNETNDIIVCNVAFYATANTQIKITLTPSSEANYDFGAIGVLGSEASPGNSRWLESASQSTIKNTGEGTYMLKKASGVTPVNTTITIPSTGEYYIEIAYACDVDVDNDDTATFVFEKTTGTVTWRSVTKVAGSQWMTFKGKAGSFVPYAWFDPEDPMAENVPATGYKFRPTKCINALTGEEWMAGGNMHVNQNGDVTMQNAVIEGSLMYHKTLVDKADNFIRPFTMWNAGGTAVDIDGSATVERVTLQLDTIIIAGSTRTGTYNLFTGIVVTGYTVILPPAKFFLGMRIKIVNGTFTGGNGNAAVLSPSPINLAVIYRSDTEELVDNIDNSYDANMIAAALPVTFNYSAGDFTFIGAPDSTKHQDYTPSTADRFTCYGLKGSSDVVYKSIELAALLNPYVSGEHYCWMIIDARQ